MLVAPHQFVSPAYVALQPDLSWWGGAFLLAGTFVLETTVLTLPRPVLIAGFLVTGGVLILLALGFATTGGFTGGVTFGMLGIGTAVAPLLFSAPTRGDAEVDLLAVVVATTAILLGAIVLVYPRVFQSSLYNSVRPYQSGIGLVFLASGLALVLVTLYRPSSIATWAAHLAFGATFLGFAVLSALPLRGWTGLAYYGGLGLIVAALPWLGPRLRRIDRASLRTRLALILIAAASLPLLLGVTVIADRFQEAAIDQELTTDTTLATTMSRASGTYFQTYEGALSAIASRLDVASLPASQQRALLQSLVVTDALAFSTFTASGEPIARSDDSSLVPLSPALIAGIRQRNAASLILTPNPRTGRMEFVFAAPVRERTGTIGGFVAVEVEASHLVDQLSLLDPVAAPNSAIYLVDARGKPIVGPSAAPRRTPPASELSPAVAALVRAGQPDALDDRSASPRQLVGFAPVPSIGGGLIVEHSAELVLASTYALRDLAFAFLVLVVAAAAICGMVIARYLVAPLQTLDVAVDRLAAGDAAAPLPSSGISEIQNLAEHFGTMREEIVTRTAERERAEAEREKALARERVAREQAEAAVRARDEFLSIAAHELKTPMVSLRLTVQFIQRQFASGLANGPREFQRVLQTADQQTTRLNHLVVQLLDVSRLQLGHLVLDPAPADLSRLVEDAVELARARVTRHDLVLQAPPQARVILDVTRFEQVITNLLDNAIKYSPNGGRIEVTVEPRPPDLVRLSVRDHGIGIPPEYRARVFELFYQAHAESHRSGMGIGLYVSRQIVELHGGRIALAFPEDGGTAAIVDLPIAPSAALAPQLSERFA